MNEEDIKILEDLLNRLKYNISLGVVNEWNPNETFANALENLINRNKELEEMLKHRIKYTNELEQDLFENASNYVIPKSKVKEKIEEYRKKRNELANGHFWDEPDTINQDRALFVAGETLKLLLEE